jgi:pimeloyl-ACP methyl ester carboxylesterase
MQYQGERMLANKQSIMQTKLLKAGTHAVELIGLLQRYHVAGNGPPCIAHSGGPGIDWEYLRMPLLEKCLTMIYVEPIGTGSSRRLPTHPAGYGITRYAAQVEALVRLLDLPQVFVLGHSHGGFVVQQFALNHPDLVAGLILYSSSVVTGPDFMPRAAGALAKFVAAHPGDELVQDVGVAWQSMPAIRTDTEYTHLMQRLLPVYFDDYRRGDIPFQQMRASIKAHAVTGDGQPFDLREVAATATVPTLVMTGSQDFICGPHWAEVAVASYPNAQQVIFPHAGHFAHIEQPVEFAKAIQAFVASSSEELA